MRDAERPRPGRPPRETDHPLGRRLREQRLAKGWTVRELALKLGLNESAAAYVSQLEAGLKTPNERLAHQLAAVLDDESGMYRLWAQLGRRSDPLRATRAIAQLAVILQDPRLEESLRGIGDSTMITAPRSQQPLDASAMRLDSARERSDGASRRPGVKPPARTPGLGGLLRKLFSAPGADRADVAPLERPAGGEPPEAAALYRTMLEQRAADFDSPSAAGVGREWARRYLPRLPVAVPDQRGPLVRELHILPDVAEPERLLARPGVDQWETVRVDGATLVGSDPELWFASRVTGRTNSRDFGLLIGEILVMQVARRPLQPRSLCLVHRKSRLRWEMVLNNGRHSIVMDESGESFTVLDGDEARVVAVALARLERRYV
jgi:transcriptional regulator with XRE-family HTH domain